MAQPVQTLISLDSSDYEHLAQIAADQGRTVPELIRTMVEERLGLGARRRKEALEDLFKMSIPLPDWEELERELEEAHDGGLP